MTDADPTPADDVPAPGAPAAAEPVVTDPDELMKQKYRDALAHKHGTSGAKKTAHGDKGEEAHSQSAGPTQKMFRRKAGG